MTPSIETWIYRIGLFTLLFGLSALSYGGNFDSALLLGLTNISPLVGLAFIVTCFFSFPWLYKVIAWTLVLGVILLVLESKYEYDQFVYSYFVIKRFAYCSVALAAYYVVSKAGPLKIEYANYLIFGFFFYNQIVLQKIFGYDLTSDTRTTLSPDALYLVIPFIYYLVIYIKERRIVHLFGSLFVFVLIVLLLHRTVISAAVVAAAAVIVLAFIGKVSTGSLPMGRTLVMFALMIGISSPFTGLLPESKTKAFIENVSGIFSPREDNTGSWRMEQGEYYLSKVPERPWFGWRYVGYDKGEIMDNDDFPDKGTIIHSQYIDMLFNYGIFGLAINLVLLVSALIALFWSRRTLSTDQLVLFGFIVGTLVYGISYQMSVYLWAFVGVGMYYGLHPPAEPVMDYEPAEDEDIDAYDSSQTIAL